MSLRRERLSWIESQQLTLIFHRLVSFYERTSSIYNNELSFNSAHNENYINLNWEKEVGKPCIFDAFLTILVGFICIFMLIHSLKMYLKHKRSQSIYVNLVILITFWLDFIYFKCYT